VIRLALVVLACAGCDKLLSLDDIKPPRVGDAMGDSSPVSCSQQAAAFVCADFDETTLRAYEFGNPRTLPASAVAVPRPPANSQPNALWLDGNYTFTDASSNGFTRIEATFELDVESYVDQNDTVGIVALRFDNADCGPCDVKIELDPSGGPGVIVAADWPPMAYDHHALSQLPPPGTFLHVDVWYDLANGQASAQVGAAPAVQFTVGQSSQSAMPNTEIGALLTGTAVGVPVLAIDDVVVTVK
jgi:hypothetical protein